MDSKGTRHDFASCQRGSQSRPMATIVSNVYHCHYDSHKSRATVTNMFVTLFTTCSDVGRS